MQGYVTQSPIITSPQYGSYYPGSEGFPKKRERFTFACPSSYWCYIFALCTIVVVGVVGTVAAAGLVLGIVDLGSGTAAAPAPAVQYYYGNAVADTVVPQAGVTVSSTTPSPSPSSVSNVVSSSVSSTDYQDLEARVAGLEAMVRNLNLQPGPPGPRGAPGICTTDQCGTATTSQGSTSTLRVSGDASNLMPATIAQGPVSVRVANGSVEVIQGGLSTKGPITTQSMFASPSDRRVKFNVTPRNITESMKNILGLSPVEYDYHSWWVEHTGRRHTREIGFIAQQVEDIFPFSVTRESLHVPGVGSFEDFAMLNERAIIAELVAAIHYLYDQNSACKCN